MTKIFEGVRRGDVVLATLTTALGVVLMVEDITNTDAATRTDSSSWLMIPVFAVATAAILWRRRSMPAVLAVTAGALAVHLAAFGWEVRCGAGLPLAFALAYGSGRLDGGKKAVAGLVATVGIQVLVLAKDSAAGLDIIPVTALLGAACWGVGLWLRHRAAANAASSPVRAETYA